MLNEGVLSMAETASERYTRLKAEARQAKAARERELRDNPLPPRPPARLNPEPIGEQRVPLEVKPRDELQEQIDFIRWVTSP